MQSVMKKRTINQIIASRKSHRQQKEFRGLRTLSSSIQMEVGAEFKMDVFLKKSVFNNEDKFLLLRHLEKKFRLRFDPAFNTLPINWVVPREKRIIDKYFDPQRKSYFLLKGRIAICEKVQSLRDSQQGEGNKRYQQMASVQAEKGIGALFSGDSYQRTLLMCEHSVILQIQHGQEGLALVQRGCLLTNDEREAFVRSLPLFRPLANINKYYTPFFQVRRYSKGEMIYQIGEQAHCLYLLVQGEVQFESRVLQESHGNEGEESISKLILKNCWESYLPITTEIVSRGSYFGEEEVLQECPRKQNARCLTLSCLIMEIPLEKLNKLLFYTEFRDALQSSALSKSQERARKVANFLTHRGPTRPQSDKKLRSIQFSEFNEAVFNACTECPSQRKLSLKDRRTKILHGSALRLHPPAAVKADSFSMLQVNQQMYHSSLKKYRSYSQEESKASKVKGKGKGKEREGRSLRRIWRVLQLEKVIQDEQKVGIEENTEGKAYFNAHLRLVRHIKDVKSYRPKTISSNCKVKTQFVEYLQRVL